MYCWLCIGFYVLLTVHRILCIVVRASDFIYCWPCIVFNVLLTVHRILCIVVRASDFIYCPCIGFYILLTVHRILCIVVRASRNICLKKTNLMHNLSSVHFVKHLYMFRACLQHIIRRDTIWIQQLVLTVLCRWLSVVPARTTDSHLQRTISINCCIQWCTSWWCAVDTPETCRGVWRNVLKINYASSWFFFKWTNVGFNFWKKKDNNYCSTEQWNVCQQFNKLLTPVQLNATVIVFAIPRIQNIGFEKMYLR
jgi:hypothetical protein